MSDRELDIRVSRAFDSITPDILSSVLADCAAGREPESGQSVRRKPALLRYMLSIAAVLALCVCSAAGLRAYSAANALSVRVTLDVNPSVEMTVNARERVIAAAALNKDGEAVLDGRDYTGERLDEAVTGLVDSMLELGYLRDTADTVLLTVQSELDRETAELQDRLSQSIKARLESGGLDGAVISQGLEGDGGRELAEEYGISAGKARLIRLMLDREPGYSAEELVPLRINDLVLLLGLDGGGYEGISCLGLPSERGYVGRQAASDTALADAGAAQDPQLTPTVDYCLKDGALAYAVSFVKDGLAYFYDVNASTGEIIDGARAQEDALRQWSEEHGGRLEAWGESYGDAWEKWGESYGESWEDWGESIGESWESWAKSLDRLW